MRFRFAMPIGVFWWTSRERVTKELSDLDALGKGYAEYVAFAEILSFSVHIC
jgi:uncharacterized membrane protein YhfC